MISRALILSLFGTFGSWRRDVMAELLPLKLSAGHSLGFTELMAP